MNGKPGPTAYLVVGELNGTPVKVTLNADSRPEQVEVRYRDRVITAAYSGYGDLNEKDLKADIFFPARIVQTVDGQTVLDLTIEKTEHVQSLRAHAGPRERSEVSRSLMFLPA